MAGSYLIIRRRVRRRAALPFTRWGTLPATVPVLPLRTAGGRGGLDSIGAGRGNGGSGEKGWFREANARYGRVTNRSRYVRSGERGGGGCGGGVRAGSLLRRPIGSAARAEQRAALSWRSRRRCRRGRVKIA